MFVITKSDEAGVNPPQHQERLIDEAVFWISRPAEGLVRNVQYYQSHTDQICLEAGRLKRFEILIQRNQTQTASDCEGGEIRIHPDFG